MGVSQAGDDHTPREAILREVGPAQVGGPTRSGDLPIADQQGVRVYLDLVALQEGRAQVAIVYGAGLSAPPKPEELRLARTVARRMAKAMSGSS